MPEPETDKFKFPSLFPCLRQQPCATRLSLCPGADRTRTRVSFEKIVNPKYGDISQIQLLAVLV